MRSTLEFRFLVLALLLAATSVARADADDSIERGSALYDGRTALHGRLDTHVNPLPAQVVACVNCHAGRASDAAPDLRDGWLATMRSRRNGPPAAYDAALFCTALRTGFDPVQIRLPTLMPRFEMSDQACNDLWNYLSAPGTAR